MIDIRGLLQTSLDTALYPEGIFSYWNRKAETTGGNPDEYIVYTLAGDSSEIHADDNPLVKAASTTVRYYYRDTLLDTHTGRQRIKQHEDLITSALKAAGFSIPNGSFDAGDIENNGFGTIVYECEYWRVV
ncbi:hypothetical protein SAMN02745975_00530 [Geosporobacter subterraneus DSM 17957]|uniref:Uncharacterized protein n=1 Tax=Geosporobacter subterraneus DSM 17957 TaxID=1121919 RepID=A0A1M6DPS3_9FIRM|nr:hypothetical protein [Geosporobacter subterraneus]SHI75185.1 hypothetical protein SAMN02745975_00530 [Geosporobacter subterraneus DSM 17957]